MAVLIVALGCEGPAESSAFEVYNDGTARLHGVLIHIAGLLPEDHAGFFSWPNDTYTGNGTVYLQGSSLSKPGAMETCNTDFHGRLTPIEACGSALDMC